MPAGCDVTAKIAAPVQKFEEPWEVQGTKAIGGLKGDPSLCIWPALPGERRGKGKRPVTGQIVIEEPGPRLLASAKEDAI